MAGATRQTVIDALAAQRAAMEALLASFVGIDSNSRDPDGVERMARQMIAFLEDRDVPAALTPMASGGPGVVARIGPSANAGHVLMLGHMDTVFPTGEARARPYRAENGRGYGPGVADMKAGLVMNAFVIAAFRAAGGPPVPLVALFTGDEEIGSLGSRATIEDYARGARLVLNSEPGRANGNIVSRRRGGSFLRATVTGRAAHAGLNPEDGRSAIGELARKIVAWHALADPDRQISVNVGLIAGGQSANTVAPFAEAHIDLRFAEPAAGDRAEAELRRIAEDCATDGLSGTLEKLAGFLPLFETEASRRAVDRYLAGARSLGLEIDHEFTRSCADSGFTAAVGAPTVCAVGPVGGKAHSPDEYVELDSLVPRAQAAALAIFAAAEATA